MIPSHETKGGKKRYRYYVCGNAQKRGWDNCPSKSIPAAEIERFVIDQIRQVANEPDLIAATHEQIRQQIQTSLEALKDECVGIEQDLARANAELRTLVTAPDDTRSTDRQADLLDRTRIAEQRLTEICVESDQLRSESVTELDVAKTLQQFDPVWESLSPREQARVLEMLIERVDYDGAAGTVSVTFRPTGSSQVAEELEFEEVAV